MDFSEFLEDRTNEVLAEGKSAVARRYVPLASKARIPSLDLRSLFAGAERF